MAIAFVQRTAMDFRVIDFMQDNQKTLEWYVEQMEKLPYRWGTDFLPHDGAHGDFKTGQTAQQILEDMGRQAEVLERAGLESVMAAKADGHAADAALMSDSWPNTSR